jgi:hypothetical protein
MKGEGELVMWLVGELVSGLVQIRWGLGYSYVVIWLCGYVVIWLCGYVVMWLCGYVVRS